MAGEVVKVVIMAVVFFVLAWSLFAWMIEETIYLNDKGKTRVSVIYSLVVTVLFVLGLLLLTNPFYSVFAVVLALFVVFGSLFLWAMFSGPMGSEISFIRAVIATVLFSLLWGYCAMVFASFAEGILIAGDVTWTIIWYYNSLFLVLIEIIVWVIYFSRQKFQWWRVLVVIIGGFIMVLLVWQMIKAILGILF